MGTLMLAECFRNGIACTVRQREGTDEAGTFVLGDQILSLQGKVCFRKNALYQRSDTSSCTGYSQRVWLVFASCCDL
jgi:hypothetical protein